MTRRTGMILLSAMACISLAGPARADNEDVYKGWTTKVVLHPGAEPHPALKYQLLPPLRDRRLGNALIQYLMAPLGEYTTDDQSNFDPKFEDDVSDWGEPDKTPLAKLRTEPKLRDPRYSWIGGENALFEQLDRAARCDSCDWENPIYDYRTANATETPHIHKFRSLMRLLVLRARLQIADGKYDAAIHTIQTGYAMARHVAQGHAMMHSVVGVALAERMNGVVEELVQQPDAPNLYWALASLPRPFIDFRPGWEAEMDGVYFSFPELRDLAKKNYSPERWDQLLQQTVDRVVTLDADMRAYGFSPDEKKNGSDTKEAERRRILQAIQERYSDAKRSLIANGQPADEVEAMPHAHVVLLYTMQTYDELRDDSLKYFFMPHPQVRKRMEQAVKPPATDREIIPLFRSYHQDLVLPFENAQTRVNRNLNALQVLEAIRLYAGAHEGQLPDRLADITEVPIPLDPFRGEPFLYERTGKNTAALKSPPNPITPLCYEIQFDHGGVKP